MTERSKIVIHNYRKLAVWASVVALVCSVLAITLRWATEFMEEHLLRFSLHHHSWLLFILPGVGLLTIHILRYYFFKNRKNKGITEIYNTLDQRKEHLPFFKIPSHYLNGFLTVALGGSTGIEVATVVSTATVGNMVYEREFTARTFKRELICAGVAAGVTILFSSPLTGWLFAIEVISRKWRKSVVLASSVAAGTAGLFAYMLHTVSADSGFRAYEWKLQAIPFFLILSILTAALAAYFTVAVIHVKSFFSGMKRGIYRTLIGSLILGILIWTMPALYGDGYFDLHHLLRENRFGAVSLIWLFLFVLVKPVATSITLGAGGDGGVFAPGIVTGAFLGIAFAVFSNTYLGTQLIPTNFALVGAACTLASVIKAPLTALALACNLVPNGYILLVPLLVAILVSTYLFGKILPYNVYTYDQFMKESKH